MEVGNHSADWNHIAKDVAEVEAEGGNVMQQHLVKVAFCLVNEHMPEQVAEVVAESVEAVLK